MSILQKPPLSFLAHDCSEAGALTDVQSFIEQINRCRSAEAIGLLLEQIRSDMGFQYHALIHHVDHRQGDEGMIRLENYPTAWVEVFLERELFRWDPIHVASRMTTTAFAWGDVSKMMTLERRQAEVLEAAALQGLGNGMTVPIHIPGRPSGSCSFGVRTGIDLPRSRLAMVHVVGSFAFAAVEKLRRTSPLADQRIRLTSRQIECTVLAGRGKSDAEIATALGIKESTATEHLEAARARYGVTRRMQLVLKVVEDGTIQLSDLL